MEEKKKEENVKKSEEAKKSEKSNLNDIILDKINKEGKKTSINVKKILLATASLILVFLIVLVIMKLVNNQSEQNDVNLVLQNEQPSPVVEPVKEKKGETKEEEKEPFKEVPTDEKVAKATAMQEQSFEEEDDDKAFEEMVKSLKEKEKKNEVLASVAKEESKSKEPVEQNIKAEIMKDTSSGAKKEKIKEENIVQKSVKRVEEEVKKSIGKIKTVVKEEIHKPSPKKVTKIEGYFIQVSASFTTSPSKSFLKKIRDNGFEYIIKKSMVRGQRATKVLIGPFSSKKAASNALTKVKRVINPDAFIIRMK